jgi:hypothetical protein
VREDWRLVAAGVLGLGVVAALVTAGIVLVSRGGDGAGARGQAGRPADISASGRGGDGAGGAERADADRPLPQVRIDDFVVPDEGRRLENWWWERYRTPGKPWSEADVNRFWIDPEQPAREYLRERNDEEIERIFRNVP